MNELAGRRHRDKIDAVSEAAHAAEVAGGRLRKAILSAVEAGVSGADVGRAAGISRSRVSQILSEERKANERGATT